MTRKDYFNGLSVPKYRWEQMQRALFESTWSSWQDLSTWPKDLRQQLEQELPWVTYTGSRVLKSAKGDTYKALLTLQDGQEIETVLMENRRGQWSICVSSQVGCAMACTFCATGKMGLIRSLSSDEIVDQYRFWAHFLRENPELPQRISNVVFMGMGEPLANYEAVKETLQIWLKYTDMGPTHITVSTVGVLPALEQITRDEDWPPVRVAISLHSADEATREDIVPTTIPGFLVKLEDWCHRYLQQSGNRRHHLTFEYVMLSGVNDTDEHARKLADFARRVGHAKVNLIPYNFTDLGFQRSVHERTRSFKELLEAGGATVTIRKTMGDDIAAACGQLITIGA